MGIEHLAVVSEGLPYGIDNGCGLLVAGAAPHSEQVLGVACERSDDCNRSLLCERENVAVVLQKHYRLGCSFTGKGESLFSKCICFSAFLVKIAVRVLEEAEFVFCLEDSAAGGVDVLFRYLALVERLLEGLEVAEGHHIHIETRLESLCRYGLGVAETVGGHFSDCIVVGNHKAVESPLVPEEFGKEPVAARCRYALDEVERGHSRTGTCLESGLVRFEVIVVHIELAHIHRVVVTAGL